jgi:rhodanese-related sulfurtransferase
MLILIRFSPLSPAVTERRGKDGGKNRQPLSLTQIQRMKRTLAIFLLLFGLHKGYAQNPVNWTQDQLLEPADLAKTLTEGKALPLIYSVGPGALIPNSVAIGMANEKENMEKFKKGLSALPKDAPVVIYCGCCPYEHCPNVRPAIDALKELGFSNYKLLNLPKNLKTDWISKGYPTVKQ